MLDVPSITFLSNYLQDYPSTVLVVSHDRSFLNEVATDIIHQHSERLDYYRGANFGQCLQLQSLISQSNIRVNNDYCRLILCHERGAEKDGKARVRESNGGEGASAR